uniref:LIM zinc-binding domain-containing protein n=1 Tax=Xiphophorus couchianus TaxID=32473 RepID=A0A3B5M7N9_9TELE
TGNQSVQEEKPKGTSGSSSSCLMRSQKVYVMERLSAEGLFFHRSCFRCDSCTKETVHTPPSLCFLEVELSSSTSRSSGRLRPLTRWSSVGAEPEAC